MNVDVIGGVMSLVGSLLWGWAAYVSGRWDVWAAAVVLALYGLFVCVSQIRGWRKNSSD